MGYYSKVLIKFDPLILQFDFLRESPKNLGELQNSHGERTDGHRN